MDGWTDGWMDGWMDGWLEGWMEVNTVTIAGRESGYLKIQR